MPEKLNLTELLEEIKENDEAAAEQSRAQLTQREIRKLVSEQLGEMLPADDSDTLEDDDQE